MTKVQFYDRVDDQKLKFAVIVTKTNGHWVFCKHRDRDTLEVPGGHREPGHHRIRLCVFRHSAMEF